MLDEGVFDHLEARLYPDWLGVKCNRALVPAVREFLTFSQHSQLNVTSSMRHLLIKNDIWSWIYWAASARLNT